MVYSIDNRESFEEVKRLQEQVWESKQGRPGVVKVRIQEFDSIFIAPKINSPSLFFDFTKATIFFQQRQRTVPVVRCIAM